MVEAFHLGGFGMYPTLFFGVLLLVASVRYAIKPENRYIPLQVSLGILTLLSGALGFVTGVINSFMAMGDVVPDKRWVWMFGVAESLHCIGLALILAVLAGIATSIGSLRFAQAAKA